MTAENCKSLGSQPDIDGFLVGGASLKPACEFPIPRYSFKMILNLGDCSCRYHQCQPLLSHEYTKLVAIEPGPRRDQRMLGGINVKWEVTIKIEQDRPMGC